MGHCGCKISMYQYTHTFTHARTYAHTHTTPPCTHTHTHKEYNPVHTALGVLKSLSKSALVVSLISGALLDATGLLAAATCSIGRVQTTSGFTAVNNCLASSANFFHCSNAVGETHG